MLHAAQLERERKMKQRDLLKPGELTAFATCEEHGGKN
jgi:hypothetical protein